MFRCIHAPCDKKRHVTISVNETVTLIVTMNPNSTLQSYFEHGTGLAYIDGITNPMESKHEAENLRIQWSHIRSVWSDNQMPGLC